VFVGSFLEVPLADIIAPQGLSNIVWMAILILAMLLMFRKPEEVRELSMVIVLVGLARALFGLVRWVAFGGDPANAYANRHGLDLKLTFFDISDNLVCWFALCIALIQLFRPGQSDFSRMWRLILWATVVVCAACIILSFRRTAWLGFLLGGAFLLMQLPVRHRLQIMLLGVTPALAGLVYGAWKRLSQTKGAGGLGDFFFDIQSKRIGAESPRLLELKLAWADFIEHPIFGIGSWGRYKGHELISWQTGEYGGTFIHSGVLHIGLKSGFIGLVLVGGLAVAFIQFWRLHKERIDPVFFPLAIAGVSGVLFMLPDMLIGTPIPQIRTMQMMAFCLGLPYVAYGVTHWAERKGSASAVTHNIGISPGWAGNRVAHSFRSIDVR
jgi:O-antigen ligase